MQINTTNMIIDLKAEMKSWKQNACDDYIVYFVYSTKIFMDLFTLIRRQLTTGLYYHI